MTIFRKFRKNRKNGHFLQSLTLKMVGLLQLKLPTSTLVGFLINGLIMNILQHIFPQAENLVFQFQKSRGRIFCVFPRLLLLQSKSLRPLLAGEFVGRSSETQREMRKQRILSGTANGPISPQNQPQKRKNRPEVRSAENRKNGRGRGIRTHDFLLPKQTRYRTALYPVVTFEKPFAGRIRLLLKKTSRHAWKSRLFSSLSLLPALPVTPSLGPFLQNIGEAEERPH